MDASYFISSSSNCPNEPDSNSCKAEGLKVRFAQACEGKDSCEVEVVKKNEDRAREIYPCQGGLYFQVDYKCEPGMNM